MDLQKKIYGFILDYWKLIKKWTPRPSEYDIDAWDRLVDDADALHKKYMDNSREYQFFKDLIILWLRYVGKHDLSEV